MREEESKGSSKEEKDNEELRATFVGPRNAKFMTLHKYRGKGYKTLCYTPQGSKSLTFDMCNEKEFEVIQNLIKNPLKGTTWSVLACDSIQEKKTQMPQRYCAPGFTTASDNDSSTKESPIKVDKTTRHHCKQSGASGKINDCQASSKGSTSHATTAKKH